VHHIELAAKRVVISRDFNYLQQIGYDHLVIALGSVTNFHDLAGVAELAVPMKSLSDAVRLRSGPAPFGEANPDVIRQGGSLLLCRRSSQVLKRLQR
jgi:hypothetical protein